MTRIPYGACVAFLLVVVVTQHTEGIGGYFPPYGMNYPWLAPQLPQLQQIQQPAQFPNPPSLRPPVRPGSPLWKRIQFMKRYQEMQRSRSTPVMYDPVSRGTALFEIRSMRYHNIHRHLHGVRGIRLDHTLSLQAAKYARLLAQTMKVAHSPFISRMGQSENIAVGCKAPGPGLTAFEAIKYWYQTVCNNNWVRPGPNGKSRPFTNIIWKSTRKFGIGRATFQTKGGYSCSIIVARYSPQGSTGTPNDYNYNVHKGKFIPAICQFVTDIDRADFVQPAIHKCKPVKDFHGQMVEEGSSCTISQLFSTFGVSKRKGKLAFRVVL